MRPTKKCQADFFGLAFFLLEQSYVLSYNKLNIYIYIKYPLGECVLESKISARETVDEQLAFAARVAEILRDKYSLPPKACVETYGCQQNVSDSEHIKGMLIRMGYELTENSEEADFVLFNTCAVREHAEARVYGNLGALKHLKRRRPGMIIAICGCMVQQQSVADRIKKSYPYVDILFGTHVTHRLPEFVYYLLTGGKRIFNISMEDNRIVEDIPVSRDGSLKGWLPIMYGCNNFCTYCIVPYVRGRERSRAPEEILREARSMVAAGFKEITLLGQNVNSYGKGEAHGVNFSKLLRMINGIEGDFKIRFMTSHPRDCTEELLDTMAECEKVCHQLHLPMQSGSDRILKIMNRHYDIERYLGLIKYAREKMPDIVLTSDIIVGFPGETYEDFCETLKAIKQVKFTSLFTFIYSKREGTPAAIMEDPVSREEKGKWFSELLKTQEEISRANYSSMVGKTYRVLCDGEGREPGRMSGRTDGNVVIEFGADTSAYGKHFNIRVDELTNVLCGTIVE